MKNSSAEKCRNGTRIARAVMEVLESRKLLSNPVVLDPIPRNQRDNYIAPTQSSADLTVPPEHYEYEYTQPRLVYSFDQSVFGVDNLSHVLTSLYQVRQKRGQRQKRGHHSLSRQKPKKNETEHK